MLRRLTADHEFSKVLVEFMIGRKRDKFGNDERTVGDYELFKAKGEWRFRVEATDPKTRKG